MTENGERRTQGSMTMSASLASELEAMHQKIAEEVLELDTMAIDAVPAAGVATIRESLLAAIAAERHWIITGIFDLPHPDPEPLGVHLTSGAADCLYPLGTTGQISQTLLATLRPGNWAETCIVDGVETTPAGCVLRAIEELAVCLGKIELLASWWRTRSRSAEHPRAAK